ncbi:Arm DNA-binding domain-containing protein [Mesobacillus subterraneus]
MNILNYLVRGGFKTKKVAREFLNKVLSELNEGKY